jgi:hypothetical protein
MNKDETWGCLKLPNDFYTRIFSRDARLIAVANEEDDAKLIALAPELLRAVIAFMDNFDVSKINDNNNHEEIIAGRAVLTKYFGELPEKYGPPTKKNP